MKIIKGIVNVLTTLIIFFGLVLAGLYILGIKPYIVLSGSMEPTITTGSLSFINSRVKYENIKEKDIIAFKAGDGTLVTHRVVEITEEGFQTQGDGNKQRDGVTITKKNFVGKNIFSIPKIGYLVKTVQSTKGKIIYGTIIVLLFVAAFLFGEADKKKDNKEKKQ